MRREGIFVLCLLLCRGSEVVAGGLASAIPELYSASPGTRGVLRTTLVQGRPPRDEETHAVELAARFLGIATELATARARMPLPTAGGAFVYKWDASVDAPRRTRISLGSTYAERAETLGRNTWSISTFYSHARFDTLDGDSLGHLVARQQPLSDELLAQLPASDRMRYEDDVIETVMDVALETDVFFVSLAFGLRHDLDFSVGLSLNRVELRVDSQAALIDEARSGALFFTIDQPGVIPTGEGAVCRDPFRCAADSVSDSATGSGDLYLRGKWRFWESDWSDLAIASALSIPTGNHDDLLGFENPTLAATLIASETFGIFSPHANFGYVLRDASDGGELSWVGGADLLIREWLTVSGDFLGFHADRRAASRADVVQAAFGLKLNPLPSLVAQAALQIPVNREGLRADAIWSGGVEWTL